MNKRFDWIGWIILSAVLCFFSFLVGSFWEFSRNTDSLVEKDLGRYVVNPKTGVTEFVIDCLNCSPHKGPDHCSLKAWADLLESRNPTLYVPDIGLYCPDIDFPYLDCVTSESGL